MSNDATGILAYGYDLGESPTFADLDEYEAPDWWDEEENTDFETAATRRLLDASGFTERFEDGHDGYYAREREAKDALGMQVIRNSCDEAPTWILAAHVITGDWGGTRVINLHALLDVEAEIQCNRRLARAIEALGIKPQAAGPAWLLSADYG